MGTLELNAVDEFEQLERIRGKYDAQATDHNQTHTTEKDMSGKIPEHSIELMNGHEQRSLTKKRHLCDYPNHSELYHYHKPDYEISHHVES